MIKTIIIHERSFRSKDYASKLQWSSGSKYRIQNIIKNERVFKQQTLHQWVGSDNCSDETAQNTAVRISSPMKEGLRSQTLC